jgi:dephospho-CoA kinase
VAGIVFAESPEAREELKALEAQVFPYIGRRITQEIDSAQADPAVRFVVLDAAILLEAGWARACDRIVYVDAPRAVRLTRLAEGRGWTGKEVEQRERMQLPLSEKRTRADDVIDNSGSREEVERQIDDLLHRWGAVGVTRS